VRGFLAKKGYALPYRQSVPLSRCLTYPTSPHLSPCLRKSTQCIEDNTSPCKSYNQCICSLPRDQGRWYSWRNKTMSRSKWPHQEVRNEVLTASPPANPNGKGIFHPTWTLYHTLGSVYRERPPTLVMYFILMGGKGLANKKQLCLPSLSIGYHYQGVYPILCSLTCHRICDNQATHGRQYAFAKSHNQYIHHSPQDEVCQATKTMSRSKGPWYIKNNGWWN